MSPQQKISMMVGRIRQLRSDLTSAYNPYSLQKVLDATLEVLEYMLSGAVTQPNPNQIPGQALDPLEQGKAKVEFFGGPQPSAPRAPVNNTGDVHFIPGPPAGSPGAVGGQTVEYYNAPPGAQLPAGAAVAESFERNGQRVEIFGGPPAPPTPVSNQPASFIPGRPPVTVEAGGHVPAGGPVAPAAAVPYAPPFAEQMGGESAVQTRQNAVPPREDLLASLPIPLG
jgi:hypothetical protein